MSARKKKCLEELYSSSKTRHESLAAVSDASDDEVASFLWGLYPGSIDGPDGRLANEIVRRLRLPDRAEGRLSRELERLYLSLWDRLCAATHRNRPCDRFLGGVPGYAFAGFASSYFDRAKLADQESSWEVCGRPRSEFYAAAALTAWRLSRSIMVSFDSVPPEEVALASAVYADAKVEATLQD